MSARQADTQPSILQSEGTCWALSRVIRFPGLLPPSPKCPSVRGRRGRGSGLPADLSRAHGSLGTKDSGWQGGESALKTSVGGKPSPSGAPGCLPAAPAQPQAAPGSPGGQGGRPWQSGGGREGGHGSRLCLETETVMDAYVLPAAGSVRAPFPGKAATAPAVVLSAPRHVSGGRRSVYPAPITGQTD